MDEPPEQNGDLACETDVFHNNRGLSSRTHSSRLNSEMDEDGVWDHVNHRLLLTIRDRTSYYHVGHAVVRKHGWEINFTESVPSLNPFQVFKMTIRSLINRQLRCRRVLQSEIFRIAYSARLNDRTCHQPASGITCIIYQSRIGIGETIPPRMGCNDPRRCVPCT